MHYVTSVGYTRGRSVSTAISYAGMSYQDTSVLGTVPMRRETCLNYQVPRVLIDLQGFHRIDFLDFLGMGQGVY